MSSESQDERILDLLARWSAAQEAGQPLSVEELCKDCPELIDHVRPRVTALEKMQWLECSDSGSLPPTSPDPLHRLAETIVGSPSPPTIPRVGTTVRYLGDYELLEELGRGGMGVVYKARQVLLKRTVAVKMLLARDFATPADLQRFHTEAESAAQLDHPAIVPVFEVGEYQGLHYFSMGFIDGQPLSARLIDGPLPPREAASLLKTVAEGVQYAHDKGVIHRDLKPGNILIDRAGNPRVADFGLAKRTQMGASDLTGTGQILGTPSYMPPEQAIGQPSLVREAADIYALGAVLYALLTGRPPFQADSPIETLRQVLEREPVSLRQLNPRIPLDLETICLKCLEKSSARRYVSAQHLADELGRFLEGKPLLARPVGPLSRAWRWCKRNRIVAILLTAVFITLVAGFAVSSYFAYEADRRADENLKLAQEEAAAKKKAETARQEADANKREAITAKLSAEDKTRDAKREAANLALNEAENLCDDDEANVGVLWMVKAHGLALEANDEVLAEACREMVGARLVAVPRLERYVISQESSVVSAYGPADRTILIAARGDGNAIPNGLRIIDAETSEMVDFVPRVRAAGGTLAINADRTRVLLLDDQDRVRMWSLETKDWVGDELHPIGRIDHAAFSPRRDLLATATKNGEIEMWSAETGKPTGVKVTHPLNFPMNSTPFYSICFNAPGHYLYGGGYERTDMIAFDVNNGAMIPGFPRSMPGYVRTMAAHSSKIAAVSRGLQIHWENDQFTVAGQASNDNYVNSVAYSNDGRWLATTGRESRVTIRDGLSGRSMGTSIAGIDTGSGVQFRGDNKQILATFGPIVQIWRSPQSLFGTALELVPPNPQGVRFRVYEKKEYGLDQEGFPYSRAYVPPTPETLENPPPIDLPKVGSAWTTFSADHRYLVVRGVEGLIVADFSTGQVQSHRKPVGQLPNGRTESIEVTTCPLNRRVFTKENGRAQLWDLATALPIGEEIAISPSAFSADKSCPIVEFSPDGQLVGALMHRQTGEFRVYRALDGTMVGQPLILGSVGQATFHPDGRRLLVARGSAIEIWDYKEKKRLDSLPPHDGNIARIQLSPDGKYVAISGDDETVRVRNVDSGALVGSPIRRTGIGIVFKFSPDGQFLALAGLSRSVGIFHTRSGRQISTNINTYDNAVDEWHFRTFPSSFSRVFVGTTIGVAYPFFKVPPDHERLKLLVESWTKLELDENDVRVLSKEEWKDRCMRLRALGWQDEHSKIQALDGPLIDDDRAAAEWALAAGGNVRIMDAHGNRAIKTLHELPSTPFQLTSITVRQDAKPNVQPMPPLRLLMRLEVLLLSGRGITDDVLKNFIHLPALRRVRIADTEVTDEGLKHLSHFTAIEHLVVNGSQQSAAWLPGIAAHGRLKALTIRGPLVGDAGFESLVQCPEMISLALGDQVTDAACKHISVLSNLRTFVLRGTPTIAGAKHLTGLRSLSYLDIKSSPPIDDTFLAEILQSHPKLHSLVLDGHACTASGLKGLDRLTRLRFLKLAGSELLPDELAETLVKLKTLRVLELNQTLTPAGIALVNQALPQCKITSAEHGAFGPAEPNDTDREIADWALDLKSNVTVLVGDGYQSGQSAKVVQSGIVQAYSIKLVGFRLGDAELAKLAELTTLVVFIGDGVELTDAAAPHLARIRGLERISLANTKVTDAALEHLAKISSLTHLSLAETRISDAGLKHLATCKTLKLLNLRKTAVTAEGIAEFKTAVPDCLVEADVTQN